METGRYTPIETDKDWGKVGGERDGDGKERVRRLRARSESGNTHTAAD